MRNRKQTLILTQFDRKIEAFRLLQETMPPPKGWIHAIRASLGLSLRQLGKRLNKPAQSIQDFEKRELSGAITLQSLKEIADVLDLQLVYALVPKEGSLEDIVARQANKKAKEIVGRANTTMLLEDQGNTDQRIQKAIDEKMHDLINEMPNFLWD